MKNLILPRPAGQTLPPPTAAAASHPVLEAIRGAARRIGLLAAILCMVPTSVLNAQDVLWRRTLDNDPANRDTARHMAPLANGDLVVGGQSGPTATRNFIVYRLNGATGAVMWTRVLDSGFGSDDVNDLIADPATGDTYICGRAGSSGQALNWYAMKINGSDGSNAWAAPYVFDLASQNDEARALFFSPNDGHVVVVGTTSQADFTPRGRVVKLNSSTGTMIWGIAVNQQLWTGVADSSGNIFCGGETFAFNNQATITKFNSSGAQQWSQTYAPNSGQFNRWNHIALDAASGDVITGGLILGAQGDNDICAARYRSSDGAQLWNRFINGPFAAANDQCSSITVDSGGDVYLTGFYRATSTNADWYAARLSLANGSIVWEKTYNGNSTGNEQLENLRVVGSTVYLAGYHTSTAPPAATAGRVLRVMKLNKSDGSTLQEKNFLDRVGPQVIGSKALIVAANGDMIVSGDSGVTSNAAEIARIGDAVVGPVAPTVTTAAQSGVTHNSATLGGNVTADGGASVTERGIVWGASANPTTANTKVQIGSGTGTFSQLVSGLPSSTTVHVRGYAINSVGTSYGANISFSTSAAPAPEIALSGNGQPIQLVPAVPSAANHTAFGSVSAAGSASVTRTFTIANTGSASLALTGTPLPVSIVGSPAFSIGTQPVTPVAATSGLATFTVTFDPSTVGAHTATVSIPNNDADENPFTFAISGTGLNSAPTNLVLSNNQLPENNVANAPVGSFSVTDADTLDTHSYAFQAGAGGANNNAFTLTGNALTLNSPANFENQSSYAIRVVATDNGSPTLSVTNTFTVSIQNRNEAPDYTAGSVPAVNEDAGSQTVSGWATGIDDGDSTVTQSLSFSTGTNSNPGLFAAGPAVNPATGVLTWIPAANVSGTANVQIILTDDNSINGNSPLSATRTVTFTVNPVNDAPAFTAGTAPSVNEDSGPQTVAGWASGITDSDLQFTQTLAFSTGANSNPGLLSAGPVVNVNTGTLTYTPAADAHGTANIEIILTDDNTAGGPALSVTNLLTLTVNPVNDAPSFTAGSPVIVNEDSGAQSIPGWASGASDNDAAFNQTLTYSIGAVDHPSLFSAGPSVNAAGDISFTPAVNANGGASVQVVLTDDNTAGGPARSVTNLVSITMTSQNDVPAFTPGTAPAVDEDSGPQTVAAWATGIGDGDTNLVQTLTFSVGANSNPGLLSAGPVVNVNTGTLAYTPAPNAHGTANVEIILTDDNTAGGPALSVTNLLTLTVNPVNDAPGFTAGSPVIVNEDSGAHTIPGWASNPQDNDAAFNQTLTYSIGANSNPALFSAGPSVNNAGTVTFTSAANSNGVASVQVILTDDNTAGGPALSVTNLLSITVRAVNDEPSFACGPNQSVEAINGPQTVPGWATNIRDNDPEVVQSLSFHITGNTNPGVLSGAPSIDPDGTLHYAPSTVQCGQTTLTVELRDNGGTAFGGDDTSASCSFTIDVRAPEITVHRVSGLEVFDGQHTVNFGNVVVGGAVTRRLVIGNQCNDTLRLNVVLAPGQDFTVLSGGTQNVAPGGRGIVTIEYRPTSVAPDLVTVLLTSNDADESNFAVDLAGAGFNNAAPLPCQPTASGGVNAEVHNPASLDSAQAFTSVTGDVNGDEIADWVIAVPKADTPGRADSGLVAVYFGGNGFSGVKDMLGTHGAAPNVVLRGPEFNALLGAEGALLVKDLNDDLIGDIVVGSSTADAGGRALAGMVYLLSGRTNWTSTIDLASGATTAIRGAYATDGTSSGGALATGDFNGDGVTDLVVGAPGGQGPVTARAKVGRAAVLRGRPVWPATIDLRTGYDLLVYGADASDYLTEHGALALGDVNGDGRDDLVLAARRARGPGNARLFGGEAYVVNGRPLSAPAVVDIATNGQNQVIFGATANDYLGEAGALALGDVNGDGLADIVVGTANGDAAANAKTDAGEAVLILGSASPSASIDLNGASGFIPVFGADAGDKLCSGGSLVVGDVTGDGIDDILLGAEGGDGPANVRSGAGEAVVINGRTVWPASIDLAAPPADTLLVHSSNNLDVLGRDGAVGMADLNVDGVNDLVLGVVGGDGIANAQAACGEVWVVFGQAAWSSPTLDLGAPMSGSFINFSGGISTLELGKYGMISNGDVDGDGAVDLLASSIGTDGPSGSVRGNAGASYLLRGKPGVVTCSGPQTVNGSLPPLAIQLKAPAPVIDTLHSGENGETTSLFWVEVGYRYVLEASSDLRTWTAIQTDTPGRSGLLRLIDEDAATVERRFYRVRRE